MKINEVDGNATVPAGYGKPDFGVGDATVAGPNPDQTLSAEQQAAMANGEPNPGFSLGGANDPLSEGEGSIQETDGVMYDENGNLVDCNMNDSENEPDHDVITASIDEIPEFVDYAETHYDGMDVDADGVIDPELLSVDIEDVELGAIPDVELPMSEPIVMPEEDDMIEGGYAFENEVDGVAPEPIIVTESFRLPEDRSVLLQKGDQIFVVGREVGKNPRFMESTFKRAVRSLAEAKGETLSFTYKKEEGLHKVALVGRSLLVEVGKDWRIPGTNNILEAGDIVQIVSMKHVKEKEVVIQESDSGKTAKDAETEKESDEEKKAKQEAYLAHQRYLEAKAKREKGEEEKEKDDAEKAAEEKKKKEAWYRSMGINF